MSFAQKGVAFSGQPVVPITLCLEKQSAAVFTFISLRGMAADLSR
jgi:hypothetical protein